MFSANDIRAVQGCRYLHACTKCIDGVGILVGCHAIDFLAAIGIDTTNAGECRYGSCILLADNGAIRFPTCDACFHLPTTEVPNATIPQAAALVDVGGADVVLVVFAETVKVKVYSCNLAGKDVDIICMARTAPRRT